MYKIKFYPTKRGRYLVRAFVEQLNNKKAQAKIYSRLKLLEEEGRRLGRPYVAKVRGEIDELRIKTIVGNIRILFFFFGRNIVMLHSIKKKTWKLREREIKTAENRMNDFIARYERGEFK